MTATYETLWDTLKSQIVALGLTGLDDDSIRQKQFPASSADDPLTSGGLLCPIGEVEGPNGTNGSRDVGYGFSITLVQASNSQLGKSTLPSLLYWREAIRRHFHHQSPLASVGSYACTVETADAALPTAWDQQYDASTLVLRCWVLE